MNVKATVSFAGEYCLARNETADIPAGAVLDDLLSAGYVVPAETVKAEVKAVKTNENKRGNAKYH